MLSNSGNSSILLLEDEPVIGKIMKRTLRAYGYNVEIAENGLIARDKINSGEDYGVYIFDIRTPVINGIQLYEYLEKERPELTEKVIFATGDYMNAITRAFLERVNRPFLAKPYTPSQVRSLIEGFFHGEPAVAEKIS